MILTSDKPGFILDLAYKLELYGSSFWYDLNYTATTFDITYKIITFGIT
jgi:hypothetical protein